MLPKEWDILNILRHNRHDWLNQLQLINGYIAMGRIEKVKDLIDEVVRQSKNESQLSNLNMEDFAEKILTFNWESHSFFLNFEVLTNDHDWSKWQPIIMAFFKDMVDLFDLFSKYGEEQHVMMVINDIEEKTVEFDFHGSLIINDEWKEKVNLIQRQYKGHIEQIEWNASECFIKFCVESVEKKST